MTSKRLLILLNFASMNLASSYTTSSLAPLATSEPQIIATSTMRNLNSVEANVSQVLPQQQQQKNESRRVTYALGLGKNQPVLGVSTTANTVPREETSEEVYQAAQFWTGHEAVRNIPSPHENLKAAENLMVEAQSKPKPRSRHIVPTRLVQDLLSISNHHHVGEESRGPTMFGDVQAMDLNTPWVEMLIHEQKLKFG
jgi:hypothetical protein